MMGMMVPLPDNEVTFKVNSLVIAGVRDSPDRGRSSPRLSDIAGGEGGDVNRFGKFNRELNRKYSGWKYVVGSGWVGACLIVTAGPVTSAKCDTVIGMKTVATFNEWNIAISSKILDTPAATMWNDGAVR